MTTYDDPAVTMTRVRFRADGSDKVKERFYPNLRSARGFVARVRDSGGEAEIATTVTPIVWTVEQ